MEIIFSQVTRSLKRDFPVSNNFVLYALDKLGGAKNHKQDLWGLYILKINYLNGVGFFPLFSTIFPLTEVNILSLTIKLKEVAFSQNICPPIILSVLKPLAIKKAAFLI